MPSFESHRHCDDYHWSDSFSTHDLRTNFIRPIYMTWIIIGIRANYMINNSLASILCKRYRIYYKKRLNGSFWEIIFLIFLSFNNLILFLVSVYCFKRISRLNLMNVNFELRNICSHLQTLKTSLGMYHKKSGNIVSLATRKHLKHFDPIIYKSHLKIRDYIHLHKDHIARIIWARLASMALKKAYGIEGKP